MRIRLVVPFVIGLSLSAALAQERSQEVGSEAKAEFLAVSPDEDRPGPEGAPSSAPASLETTQAKVSYAIGHQFGTSLTRQYVEPSLEALMRGIEDALAGRDPAIPEDQTDALMSEFSRELGTKRMQKMQELAEKNAADGKAFLETNKERPGVKVHESGLQYEVLTEGTGPKPKSSDTVSVHYRGTLIDGTEFDSSFSRGEPAEFGLDRVIRGWTEALQLMTVGSKWKLYLPPELAYGPNAPSPKIGPNSTLVFEVELLQIK